MHKTSIIVFANFICCILAMTGSCGKVFSASENHKLSRKQFVSREGLLVRGMTKLKVRSILGPADEIRAQSAGEIWRYGVTLNSHFASLATIGFGANGLLTCLPPSGVGSPPASKVISESDLRHILDNFGSLGSEFALDGNRDSFNPEQYIRAANALLPFGKTKILIAARECIRIGDGYITERMLILLDLLFDRIKDESYPPTSNFGTGLEMPYLNNKKTGYRFPLILIEGIPLQPYDVSITGLFCPSEYSRFINFLYEDCALRRSRLHPTNDPLHVFGKIQFSDQWLFGKNCSVTWLGRTHKYGNNVWEIDIARQGEIHQLLHLIAPCSPEARKLLQQIEDRHEEITSSQWSKIQNLSTSVNFRWDERRETYCRPNSTDYITGLPIR